MPVLCVICLLNVYVTCTMSEICILCPFHAYFPMVMISMILVCLLRLYTVSDAGCFCTFVLFYLSYLSSIHEKANCIAILWTVCAHSLGSCLFRGLWATCFPHKDGNVPLSALPKDTTSELASLFSTTSPKCRAPSREAADAIF